MFSGVSNIWSAASSSLSGISSIFPTAPAWLSNAQRIATWGAADMVGLTVNLDSASNHSWTGYTGWGHSFDRSFGNMTALKGGAQAFSFGTSAFQTIAPAFGSGARIFNGLREEGILGGVKMAGSEFVASTASSWLYAQPQFLAAGLPGMGLAMAGGIVGGMIGEDIGSKIGLPTAGWTLGFAGGTLAGGLVAVQPELALVPILIGGAYGAYKGTEFAANSAYGILKAGYADRKQKMISIETAGSTAAFLNKGAFTMRSKAVQAINKHQLNARSALGQEATLSHFNAYRRYTYNPLY